MKKILFITPYFGKSGSETQLFYILNNLDKSVYQPYLFSRDNGVLLKELPSEIHYFTGYKKHNNFLYRIFRLLLYAVNINPVEFQLRRIHRKVKPDFWYINSIASKEAFSAARKMKVKVIAHVHELPLSYSLVKEQTIKDLVEHTELCLGCSKIVCEKLQDMGHKNVKLLYGFIDPRHIVINKGKELIRKEFNIRPGDFVWIISGAGSTTKGIDLLIPVLKKLKSNHKIIWIGGMNNNGTVYYTKKAVKEHFSDKVFFTDNQSEGYYNYFNAGHAYLSLSREDSYPLVLLEAAYMGKPIVGFNSGGISELVDDKIGFVVNQSNYSELANAMEKIEENYDGFDLEYLKEVATRNNPNSQTKKLNSIFDDFLSTN